MAIRTIGLPAPSGDTVYVDADGRLSGSPLQLLFSDGRTAPTILLWIASFMSFALLIVLVLWTPALLLEAQVGGTQPALVVGMINLGAIPGTMLGGRLVDRFAPSVILPLMFTAGAFAVGSLGYATASVSLLGLFAALSGFFLGAGSNGLLGVAVMVYPSMMRATGNRLGVGSGEWDKWLGRSLSVRWWQTELRRIASFLAVRCPHYASRSRLPS